MPDRVKASIVAAVFVTWMWGFQSDSRAQHPAPSPASASPTSSPDTGNGDAANAAATALPPDPAPEPDFFRREALTGDWGGVRSRWKDKGVELEFTLTQFFQGTAAGGIRRESEYNGKFQTRFDVDLGKLAGWQYWTVNVETETRFGGPLLARLLPFLSSYDKGVGKSGLLW